jgi:hypothetical protein
MQSLALHTVFFEAFGLFSKGESEIPAELPVLGVTPPPSTPMVKNKNDTVPAVPFVLRRKISTPTKKRRYNTKNSSEINTSNC